MDGLLDGLGVKRWWTGQFTIGIYFFVFLLEMTLFSLFSLAACNPYAHDLPAQGRARGQKQFFKKGF